AVGSVRGARTFGGGRPQRRSPTTPAGWGRTHGSASKRLSLEVMARTTPRSFGATLARGVLTCAIVVGSALIVSFAGNHWHVGAWLAPYLPSSDTVLLVIAIPMAFVA